MHSNGTFSDYVDAAGHNVYQIGDCGDKAPPPPPAVCTPAAAPLGCFNTSGLWCFNKTRTSAGWRHDPNRGCIVKWCAGSCSARSDGHASCKAFAITRAQRFDG